MFTIDNKIFNFYSFITLGLIAVLFTTPFLRYPYDIFYHLITIDNLYEAISHPIQKMVGIWTNDAYVMIPTGKYEEVALPRARHAWHYVWAWVFDFLYIDSTQMFLRAKIIHVVQTYISLFSIYYFSKVVIRNVFKRIDKLTVKWLAFWSAIIWITVYATFSQVYQQVWLMWYSVNYQITLPLFWYMLGLTLVLFLEKTSWKVKLFFALQILLISRFILQVHSMEFLYYLMHLALFSLIFIDKLYYFLKKYFYLVIPMIIAVMYMAKHYQPESSLILNYLSMEKLPELHSKIMESGLWLVNGHNRAYASVNELMYFILYFSLFFILYLLWVRYKKSERTLNMRVLLFILLGSLFAFIPLYQFSGGLFSMITRMNVVNRFYYSSTLFVLIPIFTYALLQRYKLVYTHILIAFTLLSVIIFSKYSNTLHHNYYKNIISIKNSFSERTVGYNLSREQIQTIGEKIKFYEKNNLSHLAIKYYAPADIAFVIKYMYKKDVHWEGRFGGMSYKTNYDLHKHNQSHRHILFEIPTGFPHFVPYR